MLAESYLIINIIRDILD